MSNTSSSDDRIESWAHVAAQRPRVNSAGTLVVVLLIADDPAAQTVVLKRQAPSPLVSQGKSALWDGVPY